MLYYRYNDSIIVTQKELQSFEMVSEAEAQSSTGRVYVLNACDPSCSRRSFCISNSDLLFLKKEDEELLNYPRDVYPEPSQWLKERLLKHEVVSLNTCYPSWTDVLSYSPPSSWRVNIAGIGDVGGTLALGLKLLAGRNISHIGIYDLDENKLKRYEYELNQINTCSCTDSFPRVEVLDESLLFECDLFIFCVTAGVPPIGDENEDVRLTQLKANSKIIELYAKIARNKGYKGIFAVMSDPVDLLCYHAFKTSNTSPQGSMDYLGLAPEQIRGFGLGVMNARALYYSRSIAEFSHYAKEGRAYGPHGKGIIIADSIPRYNEERSMRLTDIVEKANLKVRKTGYKPYIAPAISSGALSIIALITKQWNYSSIFLGGVFIGCRNRLLDSGTEIERLQLPKALLDKIGTLWSQLGEQP